jgi:hypothetical protein
MKLKPRIILWILGELILLLAVFGLGMKVGSRRAFFASRYGENYSNNFFFMKRFNTHGVVGEVIDRSSSTIAVKDFHGVEAAVDIFPDTIVSENENTVSAAVIMVGNSVIVIGHPNAAGRIEARFIRVFASSSSLPNLL